MSKVEKFEFVTDISATKFPKCRVHQEAKKARVKITSCQEGKGLIVHLPNLRDETKAIMAKSSMAMTVLTFFVGYLLFINVVLGVKSSDFKKCSQVLIPRELI